MGSGAELRKNAPIGKRASASALPILFVSRRVSRLLSESLIIMTELLLSDPEQNWIHCGLKANMRCDGRECLDYRMMELETDVVSNTNGSARVKLANTDVLVGVKVQLDSTKPNNPNRGRLEFFVDCSANASPEFEGRGGEDIATELMTALKKAYNSSCFDLESLCVLPGQQCWVLHIDVIVLEWSGNLYDATSFAVKSALHNTKIPKVCISTDESGHVELEISDDPFELCKLDVTKAPCFVTLAQIGQNYVVDLSAEEESCCRAITTMAVTEQGTFCCVRKGGTGSINQSCIYKLLEIGADIGRSLNIKLLEKLQEEEKLGKSKVRCGFLH